MNELLLGLADDELVLGWRDSEWTGIAPMLEEDVAFSSIAQNEIGHARAAYELAAAELGTTPDELAFDRATDDYRCAPLVELRLLDWAHAIARRYLYEQADRIRIEAPSDVLRYVVEKGSIAVDGVSLTVADIDSESFTVSLIPETLQRTNLAAAQPGTRVNLEVDVLAKYVEKLMGARA